MFTGSCLLLPITMDFITPDIELLNVLVRPCYLPHEFPQIYIPVMYIYLRADNSIAAKTLWKVINKLESISPDMPNFILGDFNNRYLK